MTDASSASVPSLSSRLLLIFLGICFAAMLIVSLAFCVGVGVTQTSANFFAAFPQVVGDIFNGNAVAGVFVVSLLLSLFLPGKEEA